MLSSGTTAANVSLASPLLDWLAVSHRVAVIINVETETQVILPTLVNVFICHHRQETAASRYEAKVTFHFQIAVISPASCYQYRKICRWFNIGIQRLPYKTVKLPERLDHHSGFVVFRRFCWTFKKSVKKVIKPNWWRIKRPAEICSFSLSWFHPERIVSVTWRPTWRRCDRFQKQTQNIKSEPVKTKSWASVKTDDSSVLVFDRHSGGVLCHHIYIKSDEVL